MSKFETRQELLDLIWRMDQYIAVLRQRVYGKGDGKRPDWETLNTRGRACVPDVMQLMKQEGMSDAFVPLPGDVNE